LIAEVGKPADIMASADYKVIDNLLIPDHADWNIRFASNQLVLCYTANSRYADEINKNNWYEILCRKGVVWGHSDPNLDPCGYRSLMVMQLAVKYYKVKGLYKALLSSRPLKNIRPKSVELIVLLQTGDMDYAWEYRSVAVQHKLNFLQLPEKINLGSTDDNDFYKQAVVEISGKKPGTQTKKTGRAITYGVTLLRKAKNRAAALAFLNFVLDPDKGLKILKKMGQPPIIPAWVTSEAMKQKVPVLLWQRIVVK